MAGRVFKESPASANLSVPPYDYINDTTIIVGADQAPAKGAA
jgi:ubiquinol-cytochrome c reductase iron-sulfur subunit